MFQKLTTRVFTALQGRHTAFAIYFTAMGTMLAWVDKLDGNFIMLIGAIQSFVLGHSIKEDYMALKNNADAAKEKIEKVAGVIEDKGKDRGDTL